MAAGDVVNYITTGGAWTNYQPAAGVEVVFTSIEGNSTLLYGIHDGTNFSQNRAALASNGQTAFSVGNSSKVCVNNTRYLTVYSNSDRGSATGIQIK